MGCPGAHSRSVLGGLNAMNAASATNATSMAPAELNAADLAAWIRRSNELVAEHADELTRLDSAIGDADHGVNMKRGLASAVEVLDPVPDSPEVVLKKVAMTLIARVGGASGPLYGTFFLRMAAVSAGRRGLDLDALVAAVEAGVGGIVQRGRAEAGDKTMLDAWFPALDSLRSGADLRAALQAAAAAADAGRAATESMRAMKGRASYLGERSIGHIDPGASSTALVVRSLELAQAALGLATGLIPDLDVRVELAAGLPGGGLGTDTTEVGAAIERADDGEGVLVLADLGSGIMSAETALELIDPSLASRVHLSSAPVVEGLIGAYAAAGVGKALDAVVIEAEASVEAKRMQMAR